VFLYKYHFSDYSVTKKKGQIESRKKQLVTWCGITVKARKLTARDANGVQVVHRTKFAISCQGIPIDKIAKLSVKNHRRTALTIFADGTAALKLLHYFSKNIFLSCLCSLNKEDSYSKPKAKISYAITILD